MSRHARGMTQRRPVTLHAYLAYRDAPAALDWLRRALGFEVTMRWPDDHGGIQHAELRLGDVGIGVFSDDGAGYEWPALRGETTGRGLHLAVPDEATVDAMFARAEATGATVVFAPHGTEWGNYRCRVVDPEGYEWAIGTHRFGEPAPDRS
jgi:uncharacterized glyoxalase superfamily protein PhnB